MALTTLSFSSLSDATCLTISLLWFPSEHTLSDRQLTIESSGLVPILWCRIAGFHHTLKQPLVFRSQELVWEHPLHREVSPPRTLKRPEVINRLLRDLGVVAASRYKVQTLDRAGDSLKCVRQDV